MRSRSASMAAMSIPVMAASDPEEDVQEAIRNRTVASYGARVAAPEGCEHEAPRVELEDRQVIGLPGAVREPVLGQRDARVPSVRSGRDPDADLADMLGGDGVG